ncbi:MAG: 50S ribosomal protein L25 [Phycisphaerae bacterium]
MATVVVHKQITVPVEVRKERGSRKSQFIRAAGNIPGIIYGHGQDPVAIVLPLPPVASVLKSGAHTMDIVLNGKPEKVLIKAVGYDYLQTTVEHVDLMRIDPNQKVKIKVPLEFRGIPKGTKEGGILETQLVELELEVKALEIPDSIRVNVEGLELHQILHAKDVTLPAGAKLINHPEAIICQVRTIKEEVVEVAPAAGAAEPEVIGKKKEEEGAEGEAGAKPAAGGAKPAAGAAPKK